MSRDHQPPAGRPRTGSRAQAGTPADATAATAPAARPATGPDRGPASPSHPRADRPGTRTATRTRTDTATETEARPRTDTDPGRGPGAAAEDFGFLGLLLAGDRDVGGFVERTIGPVMAYDERRGTELLRTLDAYFACGMSPARTKDALHVHVNTVAQRLERVGRLLGDDWQEPGRALEIQLALRLRRLAGRTPSVAD